MSASSVSPPVAVSGVSSATAPSARVQLAELAVRAALSVKGVSAMAPDPRGVHSTAASEGKLTGVGSTSMPDGRFEVDLHLRSELVALHPLSEKVRESVQRTAAEAGLADVLGPISVAFEDVADPLAPELRVG